MYNKYHLKYTSYMICILNDKIYSTPLMTPETVQQSRGYLHAVFLNRYLYCNSRYLLLRPKNANCNFIKFRVTVGTYT